MGTKNDPPSGGRWRLAAAALLFTSAGAGGALVTASAPVLATARLLVGGAGLAILVGPRRFAALAPTLPRALLAAAALAMAVFQWSYFAAVASAGIGLATLLSAGAAPVFASLLEAGAGRPGQRRRLAARCALTAAAVAMLVAGTPIAASGIALALLSAVAYAAYSVSASLLERRHGDAGLVSTACALMLAGVVVLPAAGRELRVLLSPAGILAALYLGGIATALAYALFVSALRRVPAASALGVLLVQPLAALALGAAGFGEPLDGRAFFGLAAFAAAGLIVSSPCPTPASKGAFR